MFKLLDSILRQFGATEQQSHVKQGIDKIRCITWKGHSLWLWCGKWFGGGKTRLETITVIQFEITKALV